MGTNMWNSRQEDRTYVRRRSIAIIAGLSVATAGLVAVDMRAYKENQQEEIAFENPLPSIDFSQGGASVAPSQTQPSESTSAGETEPPAATAIRNPDVKSTSNNNGAATSVTRERASRLRATETTSASRPISVAETLPAGLKRPKIVPAPYAPPAATTRPQPSTPDDQPAAPDTSTPPAEPAPDTPDSGAPNTGDVEPPTTSPTTPEPSTPDVGEPVTPTPEEPAPAQPGPIQPEPSQPVPTEEPAQPAPTPSATVAPKPRFMFGSCKQAWTNGVGMLRRGSIGWNPALDTDGNGTACERPPADLLNP